jgi:amidase
MDDLFDGTDAIGIARAIRDREVSAADVLEHTLKRIEERDEHVNAIAEVCDGIAAPLAGPLHGVPFVIKDLGDAQP